MTETLPTPQRWRVSLRLNEENPQHWTSVRLGDVAQIQNGAPFPSGKFNNDGRGKPLIRIRDVGKADTETYYDGPFESDLVVHPSDILIGMDGDFRCRRWTGREALLNQRVCRIIFTTKLVDEEFVVYTLQPYLDAVEAATSSVTVKHLSSKTIADLHVALPPLSEQRRIVEKINDLYQRSREAKASLDAIPSLLERFRQSVLAAAFRGDLTADWRAENPDVEPAEELLKRIRVERRRQWEEDHLAKQRAKGKVPANDKWKEKYEEPSLPESQDLSNLPTSWQWVSSECVCSRIPNGSTPSKDKMYSGHGDVPFLKVYNLTFGNLVDFGVDPTFVSSKTHAQDLARSRVGPGTVLMNIVGPPLGKVSITPPTFPEWNFNQAIVAFVPLDGYLPEFLALYLRSPRMIDWYSRFSKATSGQFNISVSACRRLPLPLVPLAEQVEICRRVGQLLQRATRISAIHATVTRQLGSLQRSVLAKAFRGELVPQDPDDEPASVLLERIREERAASPTPTRRAGRKSKRVSKR